MNKHKSIGCLILIYWKLLESGNFFNSIIEKFD